MENTIFKLGSTLGEFISGNNPSGKSQGENDRRYLTDFSVNAFQAEIDHSSDDIGVTMDHLVKRNPAGML